ncbi:MAG: sulfate/molybdate ABC transporter ATP-binding protein [Candidatus Krumholzibacteriia bacterium]
MAISVRHVTKTFGGFTALNDVSLEVKEGALTALLGPSGSGKTTLLRIIAGLEQPDPGSGSILFKQEDMADRRIQERRVGFVFQHYALFRHMTVFENVAFGMRVKARDRRPSRGAIREKVRSLLALVQLENLADRYPAQLSGGQRQRVALARALAVEPQVLLLDEPFGALDAKVRKKLRSWLRRLHRDLHITSVFVTHDQEEALEVADHIVVMNNGAIEQEGTPEEVFHRPATEFVMDFLGNVNVFHARLSDGKLAFATCELEAPDDVPPDADTARVFIRPHDLELDLAPRHGPSLAARIGHIHAAGPMVRLSLEATSGETFTAEISQERFRELDLGLGMRVFVSPRGLRVFTGQ